LAQLGQSNPEPSEKIKVRSKILRLKYEYMRRSYVFFQIILGIFLAFVFLGVGASAQNTALGWFLFISYPLVLYFINQYFKRKEEKKERIEVEEEKTSDIFKQKAETKRDRDLMGELRKLKKEEQQSQIQEKPKKSIWKRWWFWLIAIFVIFIILGGIASEEAKKPSEEHRAMSVEEIKNSAVEDLSYDELFRNNAKYIENIVYYKGEVIQVTELSGNSYILMVYVTKREYDVWGDNVWVNYEGERILEGDIINLWGEVKGVKEYSNVFGASRSIPEITALHVEIVKPEKMETFPEEQTLEKEKTEEKIAIEIYNIGDKVKLGDEILTVYSFSDYKEPNEFGQSKGGNKYVMIDVSVENIGTDAITIDSFDFALQDSNSYSYEPAITSKEPYLSAETISPGRKTRGFITYEVPKNASGFKSVYTPSLGRNQIIVDLGK
jgi:Ca2+/Na+ antiporter